MVGERLEIQKKIKGKWGGPWQASTHPVIPLLLLRAKGKRRYREKRGFEEDKWPSPWTNNAYSHPFWFMRWFFLDGLSANRPHSDTGALFFPPALLSNRALCSSDLKEAGPEQKGGRGSHRGLSGALLLHFGVRERERKWRALEWSAQQLECLWGNGPSTGCQQRGLRYWTD